jgi:predicted MFS family arabinose efflux permease
MKESSAYIILQRKTRRLQKESGNAKLKSKLDTGQSPQILFRHSITRPVKMLFRSPIVFLLSLYTSCVYAYMYLCFTTFPSVFETHYGFSHGSAGLAYLGIGAGSTVGLIVVGALSDRTLKTLTARNNGTSKPEYRLPFLVVSAFLVPAGLFWYGWSAQAKVHFMVPIVGTSLLGAGMVIAFVSGP